MASSSYSYLILCRVCSHVGSVFLLCDRTSITWIFFPLRLISSHSINFRSYGKLFLFEIGSFFYLELKVKILTNYLDSIRKKSFTFFIIQNLPAFYLNIKSILNCFFFLTNGSFFNRSSVLSQ